MNDKKLIANTLLEIAKNSTTELIEDAAIDSEIKEAAKKMGMILPSPDFAVFKTKWADIGKANLNKVRLPRKAVEEGIQTLIGKNLNFEHQGAYNVCGFCLSVEIKKDEIECIQVFYKSLYPDKFEELKEKIKTKEAAVSFEIWNVDPSTKKSVVKELADGTKEIIKIICHGTGLLLINPPACPTAKIFKLVAKAQRFLENKFSSDLIYAEMALENTEESSYECECLKCGKVISSEKHCKDIKCPVCGGEMRRKDRPGKGQPTEKSNEVKVVIKKIELKEWICPHCEKAIGEKELFYDEPNKKWYHSPCKEQGEIILPKDNNQAKEETKKTMLTELYAKVTKEEEITFDLAMAFYYASDEEKATLTEDAAKWTRKFINSLPDSAFAAIEPAYPEKTQDKNARHLPHHNGEGDLGKEKSNANLDLSHYKNALARVNQIKPISDSISAEDLQKKAMAHLERHKDALEKSSEEPKTDEKSTTETKTDETPKVDAEVKVEKPETEVKPEVKSEVAETKVEEKPKVDETKPEEKAQAPIETVEPKIIVKVTTEYREVRISTYIDGTPSGTDEIKGYYKKITEYKDGTKDEVEEETKVEKKYTFAELEEAVNKAKEELANLHKAELEAKTNEVKVALEQKITEKETEIANLKKELETKTQELAKLQPPKEEPKEKASLEVGEVSEKKTNDYYKNRQKKINKIAYGHE